MIFLIFRSFFVKIFFLLLLASASLFAEDKFEKIYFLRSEIFMLFALFLLSAIFLYAYKRLQRRKERYKHALAGSNDALWNWNVKKGTVYFSERFKNILGFSDQDCSCNNLEWIERVHPDDQTTLREKIEENLSAQTDTLHAEFRMQHKNGSWKWIRLRARTFFDTKGKAEHIDGICSDITTEKKLSIELFESKSLLNTIINNIPVRIFWKDINGVYLGYNKVFAQDIGAQAGESYIGKTDYDMPWHEEAQGYVNDDKTVMQSAEPKLNYEEQQTKSDGHKVWLSTSKVPLQNENGEVVGVLGTYFDITEHKHHQIENEKTRRILESAQEIGHLGSWEWNMATGELIWSDEVYRIFGEVPQSFPATYEAFKSYIPQEYQDGLEKAIADAIANKRPYEYDHQICRKDGTFRLVREAGYVRFNNAGEAVSMLGTVLDINTLVEVKSTQRANIELTDLLRKFDQNVIASNTDTQGIITYASEAFSKISGYSIEELIGSSQNIVRHKDTPQEVFADMWKTIQAGKVWTGELKNRKKDGSDYWVSTTISPIFDKEKNISGYSSIRRDISHEKQVEELHKRLEKKSFELQTLNKELEQRIIHAVLESRQKGHLMAQQSKLASMGEMIGNIAHQWRQPLNALGLLLQKQQIFFDRGLLTSEKLKESIDKGTALINKMSTTIDDFRDFFKPNKEKTDFNIKHSIDDTLELIDASLYNQKISIDMNIDADLSVHGYKNEFTQVILNLINNAKDALVSSQIEYGKIKIDAFLDKRNIIIRVADNAGGIADDVIEHVFEPYFTTKEEGKGTGIGLYMSKMIIEENMGGTLSAANSDEGAIFTIALKAKHST